MKDTGALSHRFVVATLGFMSVVKVFNDDYVAGIYFLGWMMVFIRVQESAE